MARPKPDRSNQTARELQILNHVATALSESLNIEDVLNVALSEAMLALGSDYGGIYLLEVESGLLKLRVRHKLTEGFVSEKSTVPLGAGCAGTAAVTKEIYSALGQPDKSAVCEDAERLMGIDCLVAAPIVYKGRVLGVLELFAPRARKLTVDEAELLSSILSHIAVAIENANAHHEVRRSLEISRVLLKAAETISSVLEVDEILARLTELASRSIGVNRVRVLLIDEQAGEITIAAGRGRIPPLGTVYTQDDLTDAERHILETRKSGVVRAAPGDVYQTALAENVLAQLITPLTFKETVVGMVAYDEEGLDREFTSEEILLAEGLGRHAAVAIENARAYMQQQHIANALQKSFLPLRVPEVPGIDLGTYYGSATTGAMVGGDFYDVFSPSRGKLSAALGDVSGKGISATTTAAITKNTLHLLASEQPSPSSVLQRANDLVLPQVTRSQFVTMTYFLIDTENGRLLYANAGHPQPLIYRCDTGQVMALPVGDMPIGVSRGQSYREHEEVMRPGDLLLLYTDGVIEARHQDEFYGEERVIEAMVTAAGMSAQQLVDLIVADVKEFASGKLADDIALLAVRREPRVS